MNFGWIRFSFIIISVPYFIWLTKVNVIYVKNLPFHNFEIKNSKDVIFFNISFILFNLFFPDGGDTGPDYCFLGLIKLQSVLLGNLTYIISFLFLAVHMFYLREQLKELRQFKNKTI